MCRQLPGRSRPRVNQQRLHGVAFHHLRRVRRKHSTGNEHIKPDVRSLAKRPRRSGPCCRACPPQQNHDSPGSREIPSISAPTGCRRSASTNKTRDPTVAAAIARFRATVVFRSPGAADTITTSSSAGRHWNIGCERGADRRFRPRRAAADASAHCLFAFASAPSSLGRRRGVALGTHARDRSAPADDDPSGAAGTPERGRVAARRRLRARCSGRSLGKTAPLAKWPPARTAPRPTPAASGSEASSLIF